MPNNQQVLLRRMRTAGLRPTPEMFDLTTFIVNEPDRLLYWRDANGEVAGLPLRPGQMIAEADMNVGEVVDLGQRSTMQVVLMGTGEIKSFGNKPSLMRYLRFTDQVTIKHDPTKIVLFAGEDIDADEGDTAIVVSNSDGIWRRISYQRSSGASLSGDNTIRYDVDQVLTNSERAKARSNMRAQQTIDTLTGVQKDDLRDILVAQKNIADLELEERRFIRGLIEAEPALGFKPVREGGGIGHQADHTVKIGWDGNYLRSTVDTSDAGRIWTEHQSQFDRSIVGYQRFCSDLILQWGWSDSQTSDYRIIFPYAFPQNCLGVVAMTELYPSPTDLFGTNTTDVNRLGFDVHNRLVTPGNIYAPLYVPIRWFAWGY